MTRKRSKLEIYLDILKTIKFGVNKPTNIMYKCNLAWRPFKKILRTLIDNNLIEIVNKGSRRTYELTEKGQEFLKQFETAEALLANLRKPNKTNNVFNL
jgi:predicted transcriptional regulator